MLYNLNDFFFISVKCLFYFVENYHLSLVLRYISKIIYSNIQHSTYLENIFFIPTMKTEKFSPPSEWFLYKNLYTLILVCGTFLTISYFLIFTFNLFFFAVEMTTLLSLITRMNILLSIYFYIFSFLLFFYSIFFFFSNCRKRFVKHLFNDTRGI